MSHGENKFTKSISVQLNLGENGKCHLKLSVYGHGTIGTNPFYTYVTTQEGNKKNTPKHNYCNALRLQVFIIIAYFNLLIHCEYIWHIKMNLLNEITKKSCLNALQIKLLVTT